MDIEMINRAVVNGDMCPFKALTEIKKEIDSLTESFEEIKQVAINQFNNNVDGNEKTVRKYGYEFSVTSGGTYDYKHFDGWNKKKKELDSLQDMMKQAGKSETLTFINPSTGEEIPAAVYKPSKSSISIKKTA